MSNKQYFVTSKKTGNKLIFGLARSAKIPNTNDYGCEILKDATEINIFLSEEKIPEYNPDHSTSYIVEMEESMILNIKDSGFNRLVEFINTATKEQTAIPVNVNIGAFPKRAENMHAKLFITTTDSVFARPNISIASWNYEYNTVSSPILVGYKGRYSSGGSSSTGKFPVLLSANTVNIEKLFTNIPERDTTNYGPDSGGGGGNGNFNGTSDDIPIPALPTLSAVESGFLTLYSPTQSQMFDLANYMWSKTFDIDTFKKLFADPMDVIIGVSIVPCAVPSDGARNVKIGFVDTGVSMNHVSTQYVEIDCGTVSVQNYFGSALDYAPYTRFSIFLPYIGTRTINTDDVMGKDISVKYHIDLLSGTLTCFVACGGSVLYQYSGSCATQIPITSQNWGSALASAVALSAAGITAVATGGASLAATGAVAGASFAAGHVAGMKPDVQRSGAVSGAAGMLGIQTPYLIAELPIQSRAKDYNSFVGLPSNITAKLGDLSGYTEVETMHLEIAGATEGELAALDTILKGGVIL